MESGSVEAKSMALEDVNVGDKVLSVDRAGRTTYSEVFLAQHKDDKSLRRVLLVKYETALGAEGVLTVTGGHLLVTAMNRGRFHYSPADELVPGAELYLLGENMTVQKGRVTSVEPSMSRVRNIHTMNDRIVVDGVVGSCVARVDALSIVPYWHSVISMVTLPLKAMHKLGLHASVKLLDSAARSVAHLLNSRLN